MEGPMRAAGRGGRRILDQARAPSGWMGRIILWLMNRSHSRLTDWGLGHVEVRPRDVILDVGCGGGRTVAKLAVRATEGRVCGLDHAEASVAASRRTNGRRIEERRVEIRQGSVSALPYSAATFDLVTAVESHFFWPDLPHDLAEVRRVLRPGGRVLLIAEFYNGGKHAKHAELFVRRLGMIALTVDEHRDLLKKAGFADVEVVEDARRGWICAIGRKPA